MLVSLSRIERCTKNTVSNTDLSEKNYPFYYKEFRRGWFIPLFFTFIVRVPIFSKKYLSDSSHKLDWNFRLKLFDLFYMKIETIGRKLYSRVDSGGTLGTLCRTFDKKSTGRFLSSLSFHTFCFSGGFASLT